MKGMILTLAIASTAAFADDSKPIATQIGETVEPAAEAYGNTVSRIVNEYFAGTKGSLGEAARANLAAQEQRDREANRSTRRTMKECIKPGNVIDDDVKECIEGLRTKDW